MRIPLAAAVLLATVATNIGAPLNPIPQKLHRESTKEILDLEQELKKAAGEDKKPHPPEVPHVPAQALADEELVKELAQHDSDAIPDDEVTQQQDQGDDSAEEELQQEKEVAEKAAALKAAQEEEREKDEESEETSHDEEEELKDVDTQEPVEDGKSEEAQEEVEKQEEPLEEEEEEEELASLPVPNNINDLYEDYLNEQRQAYYDAKRSYGDALDSLAEQDNSKDMFVASLLETIREHPELLDEIRTEEEEEEEEEARPEYNYNAARNDQEEALRAEYMAATRGLEEPSQLESYEADPYQGRLYQANEVRPQMESYQNYPSDSMAKVVAKKWGYATPEEYFDLANVKDHAEVASVKDKKDHSDEVVDEQPQHMEPVM